MLEPGDLLFQDLDSGPLCEAIEKVTTGYQGQNFSHVGIAAPDERGKLVVIEAVSAGVKATSLQSFLGRSLDAKGRPKVVVGRLKAACRHLIPSALDEAFALRGRPYDKVFDARNDAYYCSELVYEVFRRANRGAALFAMQPMTFKDPATGRTDPAWEQYFAGLGVPVPEGEPGINPGAISRCGILTILHAYGAPSRNGSQVFGRATAIPIPINDNRDEAATRQKQGKKGGSLKRSAALSEVERVGMAASAGPRLNACSGSAPTVRL